MWRWRSPASDHNPPFKRTGSCGGSVLFRGSRNGPLNFHTAGSGSRSARAGRFIVQPVRGRCSPRIGKKCAPGAAERMLKPHAFTVGHRKFAVSSEARHAWSDSRGFSSLCGCSSNSSFWANATGISKLRRRGRCGKLHVSQGPEQQVNADEGMGASERPRVGSGGTAETSVDRVRTVECGERCSEPAQEGPVAGNFSAVNLEAARSSDARPQDRRENLSYVEMRERWEFLKHLPHKLQRDIGYIIVGPSLLSSSRELPTVSTSMLGGSRSQWAITKAWLQQLSISAVEAWFASHRSSQRLGDHFAICIEYVLRHSPHVEVQQLLTSQQVLQRVTEPVRNSRALKALESKLLAQKNSGCYKTSVLVEPSDGKPHVPLGPCVETSQDEQQQVPSHHRPTTLDKSTQLLEAMDLSDKNLGVVGNTLQENVGKRKRKLLKKLERVRLRKGKTNTIGEFDFLFEIPAIDKLKGEEFHHWEVSVKYLLYAGPWEVFGVRSPKYAAWSNPDTEDSDAKLDPLSQESLDSESCEGAVSISREHDNGGSEETRTTTADVCTDLNSCRAEEKDSHANLAEGDNDLFVENLGEDGWTTQERPREVDNFLGCYLGPHVGETLLDRKARLRNQLALSANPYAALMLRDLYINKSTDETAEKERTESLASIPVPSTHDSDGGINKQGTEDLVVVPSALLKGYLFYEYKLWRSLERRSNRQVAEVFFQEDEGKSVSGYPIIGTTPNHDISSKNEDETCESKGVEIQDTQLTENASLNRKHWMGWWTRDIMEFADLPVHQHSKWYIVPKLEWLSPVVIPHSDIDRCGRVLSLPDFVVTAAHVAEEAARLLMPRKRRFLVAEVRWRSEWQSCHERECSPTSDSASEEEQATMGAWLEVSRGFVVEDTWPVSKMYRPHGYVVSRSPSLQGRHVDVSEM